MREKRLGGTRMSARPFGAVMALLLIAGAGCLVWWSLQPPVPHFVTSRDGSQIAIASVTLGTVHQFDPAPPLFRLARWLKAPLKVPEVATVTTGKPETRVWFYTREPQMPRASTEAFLFAEDEHGCPLDDGEFDINGAGEGRDSWFSLKPPEPVAHGEAFELRAFEFATRTEIFRHHYDAPSSPGSPIPETALVPLRIPQTVVDEGIRATLLSLTPVEPPDLPHYRAVTRASDAGGAPWTLIRFVAEDRFGRLSQPMKPIKPEMLAGKGFPLTGLCRREPAWKLWATFAPEPKSRVKANRNWDLTWTPGPRSSSLLQGGDSLTVSQGNPPPGTTRRVGEDTKLVDLRVSVSARSTPSRLVLRRINGKDARAVVGSLSSRLPGNSPVVLTRDLTKESYWFGDFTVPVPAKGQKIRFQFAEYFGRSVEFVVTPPGRR